MSAASGDQEVIRVALMRELETINSYQHLHDQAQDARLKELLLHLLGEEKEHVAELTAILRNFDPEQEAHFATGHGAQAEAQDGPGARRGQRWTVGSLLNAF